MYIDTSTQSHICCTHSVSLSLSLPPSLPFNSFIQMHTHTRMHALIHIHSKSGRYELVSFLAVEEIGFLEQT